MQKKGQISIETTLAISTLIILFISVLAFSFSKGREIVRTKEIIDKQSECDKVANAIIQTRLLGDGTETQVTAIAKISTFNRSNLLTAQDNKEIAYCSIEKVRIANYTNLSGLLTIKNINGRINITSKII